MKNKPFFIPDENNLGGRTFINYLVYNHHKSLLITKPTLKTREKKEEGGRKRELIMMMDWEEEKRRNEEGWKDDGGGRKEEEDKWIREEDGRKEEGRGGGEGGREGERGGGRGGRSGGGRGGGGKKDEDFSEVYQAFKKIHNMKKPYIDNNEPKTMPLIAKLNLNRKKNTFTQDEHKLNMLSQEQRKKRRILDIER